MRCHLALIKKKKNYKNLVKLYLLEQKAKDQLKRLERLMKKLTNYLKNWDQTYNLPKNKIKLSHRRE